MRAIKDRPDINVLRAVAVGSVILKLLAVPGFSGGFVKFDVLFSISGYLIASMIMREIRHCRFSIPAFYERRVRRHFPPCSPRWPSLRLQPSF
jgi:peptidoglycan/LPS O-acetylase OafA/YrhL